jgi:hypothetical protein
MPEPPADLERLLETIEPTFTAAFAAALEAAWEEAAGRPLTEAEVHALIDRVFHDVAGDALRELFGADVAAQFYDGKKPS